MKTLEQLGKQLITHRDWTAGPTRIAKCPCGLSHLFHTKGTTLYVDCRCGKRVKLCVE